MFERLLLKVLVEKFGKYIAGLDEENLEIAVLAGEIRLADLRLKPSALDDLNLPVLVRYGTIGTLKIDVPWAHLSSQSVCITLEDVYLVASPLDKMDWSANDTRDYVLLAKRRRIREAEAIKLKRKELELAAEGGGGASEQTWYQKLFLKVIDNVKITVRNVHLRFEDATSNPSRAFAIGIVLRELHFISTNAEGGELFVQRAPDGTMHKCARVQDLALYANSPARLMIMDLPPDARARRMGAMIDGVDARRHAYVLPPISPTARLVVNDRLNLAFPFKYRVALDFGAVRLQVNRAQVRSTFLLFTRIHSFVYSNPFLLFTRIRAQLEDATHLQRAFDAMSRLALSEQRAGRVQPHPDRPARGPLESPREWWRYAVRRVAVKNEMLLQWHDVVERAMNRARYIRVYNRCAAAAALDLGVAVASASVAAATSAPSSAPAPSARAGAGSDAARVSRADESALDDLEFLLSVDDILVFRAVAVAERAGTSRSGTPSAPSTPSRASPSGAAAAAPAQGDGAAAADAVAAAGGGGGGWFSGVSGWLFGGDAGEDALELTCEERRALADAVDYHDTLALAALPPDFIIADTSCRLERVVLALNDG